MNSINENQSGEHHQNLRGPSAVAKIQELVGKAQTCFFCTVVPVGDPGGVRPMNVRTVDDDGHLWFLSASDSHQNAEIARDPAVTLYFQGSPHSDFLTLSGRAVAGVSVLAGTAVVVTAFSAGWVLSAAGQALCFIPNEVGKALLYNERVTR